MKSVSYVFPASRYVSVLYALNLCLCVCHNSLFSESKMAELIELIFGIEANLSLYDIVLVCPKIRVLPSAIFLQLWT